MVFECIASQMKQSNTNSISDILLTEKQQNTILSNWSIFDWIKWLGIGLIVSISNLFLMFFVAKCFPLIFQRKKKNTVIEIPMTHILSDDRETPSPLVDEDTTLIHEL